MKTIFRGSQRKRAELLLLILASQSIQAVLDHEDDGTWKIRVAASQADTALAQVRAYDRENSRPFKVIQQLSPSAFWSPGIFVLILILGLIHWICIQSGLHDRGVFRFGISPYFLAQGEAYRAITALFLHSDTRHLLGNMAGFMVLGSPLVRMTGTGSGLFLLLGAGTTGNLIAAGLGEGLRLSIGASTAVMAAAGLLAAGRMVLPGPLSSRRSIFKALAPLAAAATLVAMFSHGENTHVSAHFFGFLSGVGLGLIGLPFLRVCAGSLTEKICLALTLGLVLAAVIQGFN